MRHRKRRLQLNRFTSWRKATLVSLAKNLLIHQSIKTTKIKARAVQSTAEKLIRLGKENSLAGKRQAYRILGEHRLVKLLFTEIAPRFQNRIGGYTRILSLGSRRGDNAHLAIIELTEIKKKEPKIHKEKKEVKPEEEKKPKIETKVQEKPPVIKKPTPGFLGGLRRVFKKERDAL